jgi:hypothetical protein
MRSTWAGLIKEALGGFIFRFERLSDNLAVRFLEEDFDASLGFFEMLLAFAGEFYALLEELHGLVERKFSAFQSLHHFLKPRKRLLEVSLA